MMRKSEIADVLRHTGTLPSEFVIAALVQALCKIYEGEIDISIEGVEIRLEVGPGGISMEGCEHCLNDDTGDYATGPVAVSGV